MSNTKLDIRPDAYWSICVCLLLIPIKLIVPWILAVLIHELFHYGMLKVLKCKITRVSVTMFGVYMETSYSSYIQELLSAAAGPAGSLCLLLLSSIYPLLAVIGFMQGIMNLIPIYPLDGGRIFRCILFLLPHRINIYHRGIELSVCIVFLAVAAFIALRFGLGVISLCIIFVLIIKCIKENFLAKRI